MFYRNLQTSFFWIFGVVTCAFYAIETEMVCSQTSFLWALFAPLLIIPLSNAASLIALRLKPTNGRILSILATINGIAFVVSATLAVALIPLCFFALIGSVILPIAGLHQLIYAPDNKWEGLWIALICPFYLCVAMGPVLTSSWLRADLHKLAPKERPLKPLPLKSCFALVVSVVLISVFQTALTRASSKAVANGTQLKEGLLLLRAVGDENELLRQCYSESASLPWFFALGGRGDYGDNSEDIISREIFYRVNGRPFNSVPRPPVPKQSRPFLDGPFFPMSSDSTDLEDDEEAYRYYDYNLDKDFAGDAVGGIVRGLSLSTSSIEGWVDPNEAVSHLTWKMRFHGAGKGKELRAQILLPPRAVVTNCSLVVNGRRRDAVVGARESARTAYVIAAHKGQRPLLISTAGAGRVLLQSSTGWWHSDADLSLDITAPLVILANDKAALPLPILTERNFDVPAAHQILIVSPTQASVSNALPGSTLKSDRAGITGSVSNSDLSNGLVAAVFKRDPKAVAVLATQSASEKQDILQQITARKLSASTPLIVVVDGSSTMSDWTGTVCDALKKVQFSDASILWASDVPEQVISHVNTSSIQWAQALNKLRDSSCLGGQNNAEALSMAISKLASKGGTNVVWLHGPQPVAFTGSSLLGLLQGAPKVSLYEYQLVNGPNEVIKSLDQSSALVQVPHINTASSDLDALFSKLSGATDSFFISRRYVPSGSGAGAATLTVATHATELAQLSMSDQIFSHLSSIADHEKYCSMAKRLNLVTPLTSAVVLEHAADYEENGLTKNFKSNSSKKMSAKQSAAFGALAGGLIPSKPEPPMSLLVCFTILMLAPIIWLKRRKYLLS